MKTIKIVMVRHGQAEPGPHDGSRKLTEVGRGQAEATANKLKNYNFNFALVSVAQRTTETAEIINPGCTLNPSELLYGVGIEDLDTMFGELKYSALSKYFEHPLNKALHDYGRECAEEVLRAIAELPDNSNVLIVGHAVALPATAYYLSQDDLFRNECLGFNLQEAEYIELQIEV